LGITAWAGYSSGSYPLSSGYRQGIAAVAIYCLQVTGRV